MIGVAYANLTAGRKKSIYMEDHWSRADLERGVCGPANPQTGDPEDGDAQMTDSKGRPSEGRVQEGRSFEGRV